MGDSIQSELRTLENLFSRVRLNLERALDHGSSRCPITAIIKKSARIRIIVIIKFIQEIFYRREAYSLFYKKLTKERWNMVL